MVTVVDFFVVACFGLAWFCVCVCVVLVGFVWFRFLFGWFDLGFFFVCFFGG